MKFINKGKKSVEVRIGKRFNYSWITVKNGEIIDLSEDKGKRYGFETVNETVNETVKTTEGKIGTIKVSTKQIESEKDFIRNQSNFRFKLNEIDGIGLKTALDIIKVFPTKEKLKEAISHDDELPFRDDIEIKLRRKYG